MIEGNRFVDNCRRSARRRAVSGTGAPARVSGNDASGNTAGQGGDSRTLWSGEATSTNNAIGGCGSPGNGAAWYVRAAASAPTTTRSSTARTARAAVYAAPAADAELGNCILWNEGMADVVGFDLVSYSDVEDTDVASPRTSRSARASSRPTRCGPDPSEHKPDIAATSPCIDAGSNAFAPRRRLLRRGAADRRRLRRHGQGRHRLLRAQAGHARVTFSAPSACDYGSAKVSGILKNGGGAYWWACRSRSSTPTTTSRTSPAPRRSTPDRRGYSWTFAPTKKTYYRAQFMGDATRAGEQPNRAHGAARRST